MPVPSRQHRLHGCQTSQLPRALFDVVWEQLHGESAAAADSGACYHHPAVQAADLGGSGWQHPDSPPLLRLLAKDLECSRLHVVRAPALAHLPHAR
jgi:hypothetical protein